MLECATSIYKPPVVAANDLDQQHYHLATPSGVVDLRTGECSPGKPEQYMLNAIPTEWTGLDTPCPNFQHYLLSCMNGDQEMADFIVRLLGYGLLGDKFLNIWAIMYGPLSRNGKDTLMNTIKGILGDQIHARMGVSLLIEQKFPRDPSRWPCAEHESPTLRKQMPASHLTKPRSRTSPAAGSLRPAASTTST